MKIIKIIKKTWQIERLLTDSTRQADSPGITNKNNYDSLQAICYPNAIANTLTCYELYCIHSSQLDEEKIKWQLSSLMNSLSKRAKNGSFEFGWKKFMIYDFYFVYFFVTFFCYLYIRPIIFYLFIYLFFN